MGTYIHESRFLSTIMDRIGYRRKQVQFRQGIFKLIESSTSDKFREGGYCQILCGSKAEGIAAPIESDIDKMVVPLDVFCSERPALNITSDVHTVFKLEMEHTAPGYTFIRALRLSNSYSYGNNSLVELSPGEIYLSSDNLRYSQRQLALEVDFGPNTDFQFEPLEYHGPALTQVVCGVSAADEVFALRSECPVYLNAWVTRDRKFNWPPADVIREISNMECHVVPIGFADSSTFFLEWRISFTRGELRLVQSLNPCLTKVFILLKQIAKETLKPISKDITSYVMKNLVFWVAESFDFTVFTEDNLINILRLALHHLKTRIVANTLANYMIPERNLLANKLTRRQRVKLCSKIDSLIEEGHRVVLRIEKIRNALNMICCSPDEFCVFCRKREMAELFCLAHCCYFMQTLWTPDMTMAEVIAACLQDDVCLYFMIKLAFEIFGDVFDELFVLSHTEIDEFMNTFRTEYAFRLQRQYLS